MHIMIDIERSQHDDGFLHCTGKARDQALTGLMQMVGLFAHTQRQLQC